jgi:hypothetical protein
MPMQPITYNLKHFGLKGWYKYHTGKRLMKKYARREAPIILKNSDQQSITICYLTGKDYWYQTIYAIKSLYLQLQKGLRIKIYSDGTLNDKHKDALKRFFPDIEIISDEEVNTYLNTILPEDKFPTLRYLRTWHPFFRRLIDIHSVASWSIHMDSDMLFYNFPDELMEACRNTTAIYMKELLAESYFVDDPVVLKENYDIDCLSHVNGGIIAYDGNFVDYEDLEIKAKILVDNYISAGPARIEQTLMSYILYKQNAMPLLDSKKYTIAYDSNIPVSANHTLIHYIFKAKLPYFSSEWKKMAH